MALSYRFDFPSNSPLTTDGQQMGVPWLQWCSRIHALATTLNASGSTANRPASGLWIGRTYFDTDLGYPVWVSQVNPSVVWVDAAGTTA